MSKYKLDVKNDVDDDGGEGFVLNLRYGFRFSDDIVHVRGYDTMQELKESVKNDVVPCDCQSCKEGLMKQRIAKRLGVAL
jgi:hypothetical protein